MHGIREAVTVHMGLDSTYAAVLAAGDRSRYVPLGASLMETTIVIR